MQRFCRCHDSRYERWEIFSGHIERALASLMKSYSLSLFTRIGLRYVDVISRRRLGLENVRWSDLIKNSALGSCLRVMCP
ncbi:TIGR04255 family protein [Hankyongella ginsenosidimutans]|uniref:TIGR04255 family protein n=1 Tax=Hankyongella ginsenosidimutans TaxID=1763828 RepID=A0A4D7C7F1_9SPHN|nr:TIGR04255 family protein [Hankyongella ginsenosidimutans]